jgi:hypothetical protein
MRESLISLSWKHLAHFNRAGELIEEPDPAPLGITAAAFSSVSQSTLICCGVQGGSNAVSKGVSLNPDLAVFAV